jgi:excisionase family DNA binding protein
MKDKLTITEAAERLGVHERTLRARIKRGEITFTREVGTRGVLEYRFSEADLLGFRPLPRGRAKTTPDPTP